MSIIPSQLFQQTAFGDLSVESLDPEVQISAQYNTMLGTRSVVVGTGTTSVAGGEYAASLGVGASDVAAIFSDVQLIAKPGQGSLTRFSARFANGGVADCRQAAGPSGSLDGMTFGYNGLDFGILYSHSGAVVIQELTITTPAGGAENATITIAGTGYTVPLTNGTISHNANEIADSLESQAPLFNFTANEDQVVCRSLFAAPAAGAFAFSSGTAVAAWVEIAAGVSTTQEHTAQTDWNVDKKTDLDPTKINNYAVQFNGDINFYIQDMAGEGYVLVHVVELSNVLTSPQFSISAFRINWAATSQGNTTPVTVHGSYGAAFTEGIRHRSSPSRSAEGLATLGLVPTNVLAIRCREVYGDKVNLSRIIPELLTAATDSSKGAVIDVHLNPVFAGDTDFSYIDKSLSIAEVDTTANAVTGGTIIASLVIGPGDSVIVPLELFSRFILPGNVISLAMHVSALPSADMVASLVWGEDL